LAPISSVPTSAAPPSVARVTRTSRRRAARTAIITAPATVKRAPADSSGGIVSTITRIAR